MPIFRSNVEGYNKKAGVTFTQEYTPAKLNTTTNTLEPIAVNTDIVSTVVQNIPLINEGAFCPKRGELVKFVASGATTPGQSLGLAVGNSPTCWKLTPITISATATGDLTQRIGVVEEGTAASGDIGLMQYTNDKVYT